MNKKALNQWVEARLTSANLSIRQMSMEAGLDPSTVSKVLNGKRKAGLDFYVKIARVFDAVPEMLQAAGVIAGPGEAEEDLSLWEIVRAVKALDPAERQELERYLDYLAHRRGSEATSP